MILFLVSLIIDYYFLFPAHITDILNLIAELVIPAGIPTKEAQGEIKTQPVTVETSIRKCLFNMIQNSKNFRMFLTHQFIS